VRIEVGSALKRDIRVIRVLVDGAPMPRAENRSNEVFHGVARTRHPSFLAPSEQVSDDGRFCLRASLPLVIEMIAAFLYSSWYWLGSAAGRAEVSGTLTAMVLLLQSPGSDQQVPNCLQASFIPLRLSSKTLYSGPVWVNLGGVTLLILWRRRSAG
jgi:hypothetical protein